VPHAGCSWGTIALQTRFRASAAVVAFALWLVAGAPLASANSQRTIALYNIHTKETLTSTYKKNGKFIAAEMEKINWIMRDWRLNEATTMDPQLIDLLWDVHNELGSTEPIHIISGYRSRATNDLLRRTVGGQATQSRHILGKAADVHFPDVPLKLLRYSALIREKGGVGYYPASGVPFVHIDIDRPRSWPRLPRTELALLFPSGRTEHLPDDGEPITKADVREARTKHKELATRLAEFHAFRGKAKAPVQAVALAPPPPQLVTPPQLVDRRTYLSKLAADSERAKLAALKADPPRPSGERKVVAPPVHDEEHPEELFYYRPFPIATFLTATASIDDPALAVMVHPNFDKVLDLLDQDYLAPPTRLRPGPDASQPVPPRHSKGDAADRQAATDVAQRARR